MRECAAGRPEWELFAEAFALSETDPQWLRESHRRVCDWFEELDPSGRVPK